MRLDAKCERLSRIGNNYCLISMRQRFKAVRLSLIRRNVCETRSHARETESHTLRMRPCCCRLYGQQGGRGKF